MSKTLREVDVTKSTQQTQPAPEAEQDLDLSGMDEMDPELLAVQEAMAAEDAQLGEMPLGMEEDKISKAEEMAKEGKSTAEVDGESVSMSQGAARRFAMFDADGNGLFSKEEVEAIKDQIKKNNQTIGIKDNSNGAINLYTPETADAEEKVRLDAFDEDARKAAKKGEEYDSIQLGKDGIDGVITVSGSDNGKNHYEGVLGSFDYDPNQWAIGYKTVYDSIGGESVDTQIPILRYIGTQTDGNRIDIPDGVKSLDYTFEGTKVKTVPALPEGVESMHATFKDCSELTGLSMKAAGDKQGFWNQIMPWNWNDGVDWQLWGGEGAARLPSSVRDLSYCFDSCTQLTNAFETTAADTKLENMDGYARGCKNLTTIMDVSEAKLLPVSAQTDAYDGINTKMIKSIGTVAVEQTEQEEMTQENGVLKFGENYCGISMYANEDSIYATGKTETNPYTADEREQLKYVKALQDYRANDRMYLADPSAVANATSNLATTATYTDENGQTVHTTDPTQADQAQTGGDGKGGLLGGILGGDTGTLVQRLGFGFLEYGLIKKVVKNPLVALGVTAGGQALGILPGTIGGLGNTLKTVGGMFGGGIGSMLKTLGEKLSGVGGGLEAGEPAMTKEEAANMNMIKDASQAAEAQNSTMAQQSLAKLNDNMAKRGAYSAEYGSFQEAAEVQEGYGVFNNVRMASEDSMEAFSVALLEKQQADGGTLSVESKAELATAAKQILQGWSTYGENASDALRATYGGNPEEQAKGEAGLGKMMRAAVQPDLEILKGLNEQYQFLSEEDIAQLDTLQFKGLDGVTFSNYQAGFNYAPADDPYVPKFDENGKAVEGVYEDYMPETYDLDSFMDKAVANHDRAYRTENYVSSFGDASQVAQNEAAGGSGELGSQDISKPVDKPADKQADTVSAEQKRKDRVAAAESLLPSGSGSEQSYQYDE